MNGSIAVRMVFLSDFYIFVFAEIVAIKVRSCALSEEIFVASKRDVVLFLEAE